MEAVLMGLRLAEGIEPVPLAARFGFTASDLIDPAKRDLYVRLGHLAEDLAQRRGLGHRGARRGHRLAHPDAPEHPGLQLRSRRHLDLGLRGGGVGAVLGYLAITNAVLGLFNLLPGFPLDGGRVFRAIMWAINGDLTRSTRIASRAGGIVAWGMMALGIAVSLSTRSWSGLWFVLIGFFLKNASDSAYGQLLLERALEGIFVRDCAFVRYITAMSEVW